MLNLQVQQVSDLAANGVDSFEQINNPILVILLVILILTLVGAGLIINKLVSARNKDFENIRADVKKKEDRIQVIAREKDEMITKKDEEIKTLAEKNLLTITDSFKNLISNLEKVLDRTTTVIEGVNANTNNANLKLDILINDTEVKLKK